MDPENRKQPKKKWKQNEKKNNVSENMKSVSAILQQLELEEPAANLLTENILKADAVPCQLKCSSSNDVTCDFHKQLIVAIESRINNEKIRNILESQLRKEEIQIEREKLEMEKKYRLREMDLKNKELDIHKELKMYEIENNARIEEMKSEERKLIEKMKLGIEMYDTRYD